MAGILLKNRSLRICFHFSLFVTLLIQSADCNACRHSFPNFDRVLSGHVIKTVTIDTFARCIAACELDPQCYSINFRAEKKQCEFNLGTVEAFPAELVHRKDSVYIDMVVRQFNPCVIAEPCRNGGRCEPHPVTHCLCLEGFSGSLCEVSVPVPLGLQSGRIANGDLSASSSKSGHEVSKARLYGLSCWMPANDDTTQFFTVAIYILGVVRVNLTAIATQGAPYEPCWITTYGLDIFYRGTWNKYKEGGIVQRFNGNKDRSSVVKHELKPVEATIIRLYPYEWNHCIALRMELYGIRM